MDAAFETSVLPLAARDVARVWGGQRLGPASPQPIGERWLAYDENLVAGGPFAGRPLAGVLRELGASFIGEVPFARYGLELPLLVKFLDTAEWLSVQVHPDDAYAHSVEAHTRFHGKTEAWYVLEGEGEIVYGLERATDVPTLRQAAQDGSIWEMLHREVVRAGQVVFVPAGTIHALGPGLLLYEVQQRSDLTYRLYDYGRPRELHLEKGLAVSRLEPAPIPPLKPSGSVLLASRAFVLERHVITGEHPLQAPEESFLLLTPIEGSLAWSGGPLGWGETLMLGAGKGLELSGKGVALAAYIPSPQRLEQFPPQVRV
jgi:mannose-6-phosphate isomerase